MKLYQATSTGMAGVKEIFDAIGISGELSTDLKTFTTKKWDVTLSVGSDGIVHIRSNDGQYELTNSYAQINFGGTIPYCYAILTDNYFIMSSTMSSTNIIILVKSGSGTFAMSVWNYSGDLVCCSCTYNSDGKRSSQGSDGREDERRLLITGSLGTTIDANSGKAVIYPAVLRSLYASEDVFIVPDLYMIYSNVVKVGGGPFTVDGKQYEALQIGSSTYNGRAINYFAIPYQE